MTSLLLLAIPAHAAPCTADQMLDFGSGGTTCSDAAPLVQADDVDPACKALAACANGVDIAGSARLANTCAVRSYLAGKTDALAAPVVPAAGGQWFATADDLAEARTAKCKSSADATNPEVNPANGGGESVNLGGRLLSPAALVGTTDWFIARGVEEISAWSVDTFLVDLCKESEADPIRPRHLLPKTCAIVDRSRRLGQVGTLTNATSALLEDTVAIPRHSATEIIRASDLGLLEKYTPKLDKDGNPAGGYQTVSAPLSAESRDLLLATAVTARMVELVVAGDSPGDAIAAWASNRTAQQPNWKQGGDTHLTAEKGGTPLSSALYVASFAMASFPRDTLVLKSEGGDLAMQWQVGTAVVAQVGVPALLTNLQSRSGTLPVGITLPSELPSGPDAATASQQLVRLAEKLKRAWGPLSSGWDTGRRAWREAQNVVLGLGDGSLDKDDAQRAAQLARALASTLEQAGKAAELLGMKPELYGGMENIRTVTLDAADLLEAVAGDDLARVATGALELVDDALTLAAGDGALPPQALKVIETVSKATGFAQAMLTAKTPDDAQQAIEAIAAPPGGYAHKRRGTRLGYLTLNGYVGGGFGGESLLVSAENRAKLDQPEALSAWPSIVVGPEVGLRINRAKPHPFSLGLQVQVLDLGTIGAWRLGAQDTEELPDVEVGHVFAPGLNVVFGLPDAPFTIVHSIGLVPSLRTIDADLGLDVREASALRYGIGLAVDIPVLH